LEAVVKVTEVGVLASLFEVVKVVVSVSAVLSIGDGAVWHGLLGTQRRLFRGRRGFPPCACWCGGSTLRV
jgi:hypothetical protein